MYPETLKLDPWEQVPQRVPHVDHSGLLPGLTETGSDVTWACLECHGDAAHEVAQTVYWAWESESVLLSGWDERRLDHPDPCGRL